MKIIFTIIFSMFLMLSNQIFSDVLRSGDVMYSGFIVEKVDLVSILHSLKKNNLREFICIFILDNGDLLPVHSRYQDLLEWEIGDRIEKRCGYNTPYGYHYYKNLDHKKGLISEVEYQRLFEVQNISENFCIGKFVESPKWLVNWHFWKGSFPKILNIPHETGWKSGDRVLLAIGYSETYERASGSWTYRNWKPVIINLTSGEAFTPPIISTTIYGD